MIQLSALLGVPQIATRLCSAIASNAKLSCRSYASANQVDKQGWETVIGLEIHAQLKTGRKLFSRAKLCHDDSPNTHVESLDAAFPGTLPNPRSTFDRKHYFYHDIPSSYQITQHYNPLARDGLIQIDEGENGSTRSFDVRIHQLQVEQDTAKSQTIGDEVLVDLNRAGTGLMEIVTEPDMRSAEEAGAFVKKLQSMLRRIGSGDGDMEKGNLRVDANVSVHRPGTPFGTRCEIKNVNSVRFLQQAIEAETRRHIRHYIDYPQTPIRQETRSLNELTGETFSLRSKEEAEDYRYMPDSNLPAMVMVPSYLLKLQESVPEMPWAAVKRLQAVYGVDKRELETLIGLDEYHLAGLKYFEHVAGGNANHGKRAINLINHELLGQLSKLNIVWTADIVSASLMGDVARSIEDGTITGTTGKAVIKHAIESRLPSRLTEILNHLGLTSVSSDDLQGTCQTAIAKLPKEAESYRKGNVKVLQRFIGEVMKISGGRADAKRARAILIQLLQGPSGSA